MIIEEAKWLRKQLLSLKPRLVLNLGSSTLAFRTIEQPFIADCFGGFDVVHVDLKSDPGVDLVADLEDGSLCKKVYKWLANNRTPGHDPEEVLQPVIVVLSNVLEHVENPRIVLQNVAAIAPTWLYVSVPREWPYHPDPIDTMLRPNPLELAEMVEWFGYEALNHYLANCKRGSISSVLMRRVSK